MDSVNAPLYYRLKNCLQLIVELSSELEALPYGKGFNADLEVIRNFLNSAATAHITEENVKRIELATNNFLKEIGLLTRSFNRGKFLFADTRLQ